MITFTMVSAPARDFSSRTYRRIPAGTSPTRGTMSIGTPSAPQSSVARSAEAPGSPRWRRRTSFGSTLAA